MSDIKSVCLDHGTFPALAKLKVCHGRKACYVMNFGKIHSKHCFVKEKPSSSFRDKSEDVKEDWTLIPDGWKVAVLAEGNIWIGETSYEDKSERPLYSFFQYEKGNTEPTKIWKSNPSAAFRAALVFHGEVENSKSCRHNGRLLMGVHYEFPQERLRSHFSIPENRRELPIDAEENFVNWLRQPIKDKNLPSMTLPTAISNQSYGGYLNLPENKRARLSSDVKIINPTVSLNITETEANKAHMLKNVEMLSYLRTVSPLLELKHITWIYEALNKQVLTVDEFLEFLGKSERVIENLQLQDDQTFRRISNEDPQVLGYVVRVMNEIFFLHRID